MVGKVIACCKIDQSFIINTCRHNSQLIYDTLGILDSASGGETSTSQKQVHMK